MMMHINGSNWGSASPARHLHEPVHSMHGGQLAGTEEKRTAI